MGYVSPFTPERYLKVVSGFVNDRLPESGFFTPDEAEVVLKRSGMKASGNGHDHRDCPHCSAWPHCPALICSFLVTFEETYPDLSTAASVVVTAILFFDFPGPLAGPGSLAGH